MVTGGSPGFLKTSSARIGVGDNSRGESQCLSDGTRRQNGGEIVTGERRTDRQTAQAGLCHLPKVARSYLVCACPLLHCILIGAKLIAQGRWGETVKTILTTVMTTMGRKLLNPARSSGFTGLVDEKN
ncbi:predicted protein [Histoplasma capsulatum G186AR]|uniref:Uncharacterized protein n=1 Tax=Ajellomyces capsulatus (strain G186AR / H82 / ATCC MYA-2454 / RMSCC 2432) TaxID=447093 RepID=C0NKI8_AJECG|nr:uncharacterized protein HCBG_03668 [Histoplasma capsulatum G186AR]EEH08379.1 predicted protein [Histoplasma capsulatum G186AR]